MADVAHAIVRRAMDATQSTPTADDVTEENPFKSIAFAGLALIWFTVIVYMAALSAVRPLLNHLTAYWLTSSRSHIHMVTW